MWTFGATSLASIEALVEKEDTTVEMVLDDPAFMAGIRNGIPLLISFLVKPQNINRLLDLAFNGITPDTKLPAKTVRTAVSVLSTGMSNMMNRLLNTTEFVSRIAAFPKSEFNSNPRACGHYAKIVESLARFSSGQFLKQIEDLKEFLIHSMTCIGLRDLFVILCTEYQAVFQVTDELFIALSQSINNVNGWYSITAIKDIVKNNNILMPEICNPQVITNLLNVATNPENSVLIQIETFNLLALLKSEIKERPDLKEVVAQAASRFDFTAEQPQNVLAAALRIITTDKPEILLKIFDKGTSTFLNDGIISSFQAMTNEQFQEFDKAHHLTTQIIEAFEKTKTNFHICLLSEIAKEKGISQSDEWVQFIPKLDERAHLREKHYGERSTSSDEDVIKSSDEGIMDISSSTDSDDNRIISESSSSDDDDDVEVDEIIIVNQVNDDDSSSSSSMSSSTTDEDEEEDEDSDRKDAEEIIESRKSEEEEKEENVEEQPVPEPEQPQTETEQAQPQEAAPEPEKTEQPETQPEQEQAQQQETKPEEEQSQQQETKQEEEQVQQQESQHEQAQQPEQVQEQESVEKTE